MPLANDRSNTASAAITRPQLLTQVEMFFNRQSSKYVQKVFEQHTVVRSALKSQNGDSEFNKRSMSLAQFAQAIESLGVHLSPSEIEELFREVDLENNDSIGLDGFLRAISRPTKLEQWAVTLPLPQLLASTIPIQPLSNEPLREIIKLDDTDILTLCQTFCNGLLRLLRDSILQLKTSIEMMDRLNADNSAGSKFQIEDMNGGSVDNFHEGVTGRVGPPHPNLSKGIEDEHCTKGGRDREFLTKTHGVKTTPRQEYLICVGKAAFPPDRKKLRVVRPIAELVELPLAKKAGLSLLEVLAVNLYTGPMFQIYNLILRRHPAAEWEVYNSEGNLFATTIHVLVSAVLKIARKMKLQPGLRLYRGLGGTLKMPESFWKIDQHGCRGHVEWGFLSTTSDKSVAVQYSGAAKGKPIPAIMCLRVSSLDRGANIAAFSQYPHEVEYLWVPCSFVEPDGSPSLELVQGRDGAVAGVVKVIYVRGSANLRAQTVEELWEQKKRIHLNAFNYLVDELQYDLQQGASVLDAAVLLSQSESAQLKDFLASVMQPPRTMLARHEQLDVEEYYDNEKYRALVMEMLDVKSAAVSQLNARLGRVAFGGDKLAITALLEAKADVHARDQDEGTPLFKAGENGHTDCVRTLIDNGADVNAANHDGRTPIHNAANNGHVETVRALMESKAHVNAKNQIGNIPIHRAADKGHVEVVRALMEGKADINAKGQIGTTPIHRAAGNGHMETARALVEGKANVNAKDTKFGHAPIHNAAENGHVEAVRLLMEAKADVNAAADNGRTPIHNAAYNGHVETVRALMEGKASVNIKDTKAGTAPIHRAADKGHVEAVLALVEGKADVNAKDMDGRTPLCWAATPQVKEVLRAAGGSR